MSSKEEEATNPDSSQALSEDEQDALKDPKFGDLFSIYQVFNKQYHLLEEQLSKTQAEMEIVSKEDVPDKIEESMRAHDITVNKIQRELQELHVYRLQLINIIRSVLKANETLDDIKIDSIPFDKLSEHIKKLTKQIKQISNSVFTTANWLKQLEKIKGDKDDEIIATQDTLLTFKTKLLNCQLIQSDLYHSMVNYYNSLSENEQNNLKIQSIFTQERELSLMQQAKIIQSLQRDLMTISTTMPDHENIISSTKSKIKNFNEVVDTLNKMNEWLEKCISESTQPDLTSEEQQQLSSTTKLDTFINEYNQSNEKYSSLLNKYSEHLSLAKAKFGEFNIRNEVAYKQSLQYLIKLHQSLSECNNILRIVKACLNLDTQQLNSIIKNLTNEMKKIDDVKKPLKDNLSRIGNHQLEQSLNELKPSPQALHDEKISNEKLAALDKRYQYLQDYKNIAEEFYKEATANKQLRLRVHTTLASTTQNTDMANKPPRRSSFS